MSKDTNIEWCDHTFNPWIGCTKVSPGCLHCYAETLDRQRYAKTLDGGSKAAPHSHWGKGAPRHRTSAETWKAPLLWNRKAARYPDQCTVCGARLCMEAQRQLGTETCPARRNADGVHDGRLPACGGVVALNVRPRVFCASLADWLDEEVPVDWFIDLLALIDETPHLDWLLLTKRPENFEGRMGGVQSALDLYGGWVDGVPPANVWVGTSVEDQVRAEARIPALLRIPAAVRFLSCEPLLGPVDLDKVREMPETHAAAFSGPGPHNVKMLHWVICGGESGPGARPTHPGWVRSLRDQCVEQELAFFFKQWGEWCPLHALEVVAKNERVITFAGADITGAPERQNHTAARMFRVGKKAAGRLLDGKLHDAFPIPRPVDLKRRDAEVAEG